MPGATGIQVQLLDENDHTSFSISMDQSTGLFNTLGLDLGETHSYVRPLIVFTSSGTTSPVLTLMQLRSLPSPSRLRQVRYPLRCDDIEEDSRGVRYGHIGWAWERLVALEQMEESGVAVSVIDRRNGESYSAMIDEIQFLGHTAPDRIYKNFGGTLMLTLTKLT
jgi:hypothetical protein